MQLNSEKCCLHSSHTLMQQTTKKKEKKKSPHLPQNHYCQRLRKRNERIQFKGQVAGFLDPSSQDERTSGVRKEPSEEWRATQNATTDSLCYFNPNMNPVTVTRSHGRSRSSADSPRSPGFLPGCPSLWSEHRQRCYPTFSFCFPFTPQKTFHIITYRNYCNPGHRWLSLGRRCCTLSSYLPDLRSGSGSSSSPLRSRSCRGSPCRRGEASPCSCRRRLRRRR